MPAADARVPGAAVTRCRTIGLTHTNAPLLLQVPRGVYSRADISGQTSSRSARFAAGEVHGSPSRVRIVSGFVRLGHIIQRHGPRAFTKRTQTTTDIRHDELASLGTSWGAAMCSRILPQEPRFKSAILLDGGFPQETQVLPDWIS
jgi:hypothetical protein